MDLSGSSQDVLFSNDKTISLWQQLQAISEFSISAKCRKIPPSFDRREGNGTVQVQMQDENTMTFFEKGRWRSVSSKTPIAFSNILRWRFNQETKSICLDHLRLGPKTPIFLFELFPIGKGHFQSLKPHQCEEDIYKGQIFLDRHFIETNWLITGKTKDESLRIVYF